MNSIKGKSFFSLGLTLILISFVFGKVLISNQSFPDYFRLKQKMANGLSIYRIFPYTYKGDDSSKLISKNNVIYVLGGPVDSLDSKFQIASELYKNHLAGKIWLLNTPYLMDYNPQKGRNLSSKEWAIERLTIMGVDQKDIEFFQIEKGLFGTFSEAKAITTKAKQRKIKTLILVTSRHHTMRSWESFNKFAQEYKLDLFIYPAKDCPHFRELFLEYVKLKIYEFLLL